jgi:hypothetical protein
MREENYVYLRRRVTIDPTPSPSCIDRRNVW